MLAADDPVGSLPRRALVHIPSRVLGVVHHEALADPGEAPDELDASQLVEW